MLPVEGLVHQGSSLCATAAEYDSGYRNTLQAVKLGRNAGAVLRKSRETGVGMCAAGGLILFVVLGAVPRIALPVDCIAGLGRIVVKAFPPNGVVLGVVYNVGKDRVAQAGVKRVGIGFLVGAGGNAKEAVSGLTA